MILSGALVNIHFRVGVWYHSRSAVIAGEAKAGEGFLVPNALAGFTKKRIACAQPLAAKLAKARKRKGVDLRAAELETKVAMKHLQALERGEYHRLPEAVYVRGFLTRYAAFLGLKPESVLADYDQEYACYQQVRHVRSSKLGATEEGLLRPHVSDDWLKQRKQWYITPEILWGSALSSFALIVLGYIWFQVTSFAAAPSLDVVTPGSELRVAVDQVEVAGVTDPSAKLRINDQPVAVSTDGHFRQEIRLLDGVNTIEISATNKAEKETTKTLQLLADIPEVAPVALEAAPVDDGVGNIGQAVDAAF